MGSTALCDQTVEVYNSPFKAWDRQASVRSFVNKEDDEWSGCSSDWISIEPDNILSHPEIPDCIKRPLSAYLLVGNLDFTYSLEQQLISQVSSQLASGCLLPNLADAVKVDALKVQCDEAFHALQAHWLADKVRQVSGITEPRNTDSHFLQFVGKVTNSSVSLSMALPTKLLLFCAVVVSETLITKSLRDDWRDSSLPKAIRSFFHQHYKDEVQHSAYFTWLLEHVWPTWSIATQQVISELWPQFIDAYLDSDIHIAKRALQHFDLPEVTINRIINDTYYLPSAPYQAQRQLSIIHTIETFNRVVV
jgi:hypothetical protein